MTMRCLKHWLHPPSFCCYPQLGFLGSLWSLRIAEMPEKGTGSDWLRAWMSLFNGPSSTSTSRRRRCLYSSLSQPLMQRQMQEMVETIPTPTQTMMMETIKSSIFRIFYVLTPQRLINNWWWLCVWDQQSSETILWWCESVGYDKSDLWLVGAGDDTDLWLVGDGDDTDLWLVRVVAICFLILGRFRTYETPIFTLHRHQQFYKHTLPTLPKYRNTTKRPFLSFSEQLSNFVGYT